MRIPHVFTNCVSSSPALCLLAVLASVLVMPPATAQQRQADREQRAGRERQAGQSPGSIDVVVRGRLAANVMAIGGETTGTTVTANGLELELDLQNRRRLRRIVERLDGSRVLVEGELHQRSGVERGKRLVIRVRRIEGLRSVAEPRRDERDRAASGDRDAREGRDASGDRDARQDRDAFAGRDAIVDRDARETRDDLVPEEDLAPVDRPWEEDREPDPRERSPEEWDDDNPIYLDIGEILRDALRRFPE